MLSVVASILVYGILSRTLGHCIYGSFSCSVCTYLQPCGMYVVVGLYAGTAHC